MLDLYYTDAPLNYVFVGFDYIIAIFIFQLGLLFIRNWYKEAKKQLKNAIVLGFGSYFILFSIGLLILFYITNHAMSIQQFDFYYIFSIYLRGIAGIILAFLLERTIQPILKTKYLISLALIGLFLIIPLFLATQFLYPILNSINLILIILPLIFTLYFIRNTLGEVRQKLIISVPGFVLLGFGLYITTPEILQFIVVTSIFSFITVLLIKMLTIIGIVLVIYGFNGYSFFLESQWRESLISLQIIDKTRVKVLYHKDFLGNPLESGEIFAGGISGIERLVKQFTSSHEGIDIIKLENKLILLSHGEKIITALIVKKNIQNARYILKEITKKFEFFFWDYLKYYESYNSILSQSEIFRPMEMIIRSLIKF